MDAEDAVSIIIICVALSIAGLVGAGINGCVHEGTVAEEVQELQDQLNSAPPTIAKITILQTLRRSDGTINLVEDAHGVRAILKGNWGDEGTTFQITVKELDAYDPTHLKHSFGNSSPSTKNFK